MLRHQLRKKLTSSRLYSSKTNAPSKIIFSGIQPTGIPHIGNYFGALRQWVQLQDEPADDTRLIYSIVDLHALTVRNEPDELGKWKKQSLASLLAIGLDPERSTIFFQSDVWSSFMNKCTIYLIDLGARPFWAYVDSQLFRICWIFIPNDSMEG